MSGPIQRAADPMSPYNTGMRYIQEQEDIRGRERRKKLSREMDRDSSSERISDNPSKAFIEFSTRLSHGLKPRPKPTMSSTSSASSFESSASSNYSNSSLKERVTDNTKTNTDKYCSIQ